MYQDPIKAYAAYFKGKEGKILFPDRVVLEMTNCCNLRCTMCPRRHMVAPEGYMSMDLFKKLVEEIAHYPGTSIAPFFRGESLLHPDFKEMIGFARKHISGRIMLFSNAMLLSKDISCFLLDTGIDHISFSVDSVDPDVYEKIRVNAKLDEVLENIHFFIEEKGRRGVNLPEIQVSTVATEAAQENTRQFIDYWLPLVDRVRVYPEHSQEEEGFGGLNEKIDHRRPCLKPLNEMAVYWNGSVALCNHDWGRINPVGDANTHSLKDIWDSQNYNAIRREHNSGIYRDPSCSECDQWLAYYDDKGVVGQLFTRTDNKGT